MRRNQGYSYRRRTAADVYDMNSERPAQPAAEKYMRGGPSDWAEDRYPSNLWVGDQARNEIGLGEMGGMPMAQAPQAPVAQPPVGPMANRHARLRREAMIRRKAYRCVKIAKALLGKKASEKAIEDQAVEFMPMSDKAIFSTLARIRSAGIDISAEEEKEETEEHEENETVEEEAKEEAALVAPVAPVVAPAPATVSEVAVPAPAAAPVVEESATDIMAEPADMGAAPSLEDTMLDDLMGEDMMDVELGAPPMMEEEVTVMPQGSDEILQHLFDPETKQVMAEKTAKKVVKTLGGNVKTASQKKNSELSDLWKSDPDVSDVFKY